MVPTDFVSQRPRQPRWLFLLGTRSGAAPPALLRAALLLLCIFAAGWGPADYEIHIYDDYYILRQGRNVHSLVHELPPVDQAEKGRWYAVVCEGIKTYGESGGIIYGTTVRREFFVLNPPSPIRIYREREGWVESLDKSGVQEQDIQLIVPRPPEEEPLLPPLLWWVVAGVLCVLILMVVARLTLGKGKGHSRT